MCCQPANLYYAWQVEVMLDNFISHKIPSNQINIVSSIDSKIPDFWKKLEHKFIDVNFFYYYDTRRYKNYAPSIYFHLLSKHFTEHKFLENDAIFLHDCDIVFTKYIDFTDMIYDRYWYLSNTNSYIGYDYIITKGMDTYNNMCKIIGIDPLIPKLMSKNSGGAQYLVKNTTSNFWKTVENDSIKLYNYFLQTEPHYQKQHKDDYPIQKWTSGMWALLWNAWKSEHTTVVDKRLDFTWATNSIETINSAPILHNAGVLNNMPGLFCKTDYITTLPYNKSLSIDSSRASYHYWQQVCNSAKTSVLV